METGVQKLLICSSWVCCAVCLGNTMILRFNFKFNLDKSLSLFAELELPFPECFTFFFLVNSLIMVKWLFQEHCEKDSMRNKLFLRSYTSENSWSLSSYLTDNSTGITLLVQNNFPPNFKGISPSCFIFGISLRDQILF